MGESADTYSIGDLAREFDVTSRARSPMEQGSLIDSVASAAII